MDKAALINKKAWEYRAYEHSVKSNGKPSECAKVILKDPAAKLKKHYKYFENIEGLRIANPCGSCGRRALALGAMGADVTIFDISSENERYALELADSAEVKLDFVVGDLYDINIEVYGGYFDKLYLEGGVLHHFHDLDKLLNVLFNILKVEGKIVLNDFHPLRKVMPINFFESTVGDYFDSSIHIGDVAYKNLVDAHEDEEFPECSYRYYTISEILNAMIKAGFIILEFTEDPSWTNIKLPGEITIYAKKPFYVC